jgi:hypothetical protein
MIARTVRQQEMAERQVRRYKVLLHTLRQAETQAAKLALPLPYALQVALPLPWGRLRMDSLLTALADDLTERMRALTSHGPGE